MRRPDEMPIDPEIAACLDAVDATLAGEPVDPRHAELAELALLLADERPRPRPEFTASLDARAARRFAPAPGSASGLSAAAAARQGARRRWRLAGAWSAAATCAAALAVAVVMLGQGAGTSSSSSSVSRQTPVSAGASASSSGHAPAGPALQSGTSSAASSTAATSSGASASSAPSASGSAGAQALTLPPNGRKTIQSAQLVLSTAPNHVDSVAQQVFNVVGQANGIVDQSSVTQTGGVDGNASFELRLPSATLGQTLGRLSDLAGARVVSRTDNSQDVNSRYVSANRRLADDEALRTSLLRQLANATTQQQIDSLKAQLRNAEASISSDQAAVNALNSQIDYSQVSLTINASPAPVPVTHHSSGGFTLGHAAHVAGRVLVVAAGVGLIALAALVPVALVGALVAWGAAALRRRRREQALDLA